jgi:hypothetical protein
MSLRLIASGFALAGLLLALLAVFAAGNALLLQRRGTRVLARVVALIERPGRQTCYAPVYEFDVPAQGLLRIQSKTASFPAPHAVGDTVALVYDLADPADARCGTFAGVWLITLLLALGAFGATVTAFFCAWAGGLFPH